MRSPRPAVGIRCPDAIVEEVVVCEVEVRRRRRRRQGATPSVGLKAGNWCHSERARLEPVWLTAAVVVRQRWARRPTPPTA